MAALDKRRTHIADEKPIIRERKGEILYMITIKHTTDIKRAEQFLKSIGENQEIANDIVMQSCNKEEIFGVGTLSLENSKICLNKLYFTPDYNNMQNKLSLAKALLNFADFREMKTIYGTNVELTEIYSALRFQKIKDEFVVNLNGYFTAHC